MLRTHLFLSASPRHLHSESLQWEGGGILDGSSSSLLVKQMEISLHCFWDPLSTVFYLPLCPGGWPCMNAFSFSLASSWLWPMGSPCRRPEKVKVFIPWLFPSETAFGWLGSRSLLLLLWSAPNNTPFPDADNHSLRVPGCQPLCFF